MQVGAEVSWAAVTTVACHCAGADLYHIRRTSLETFNAGVAPLGSHGVGDGLTLILQRQRLSVMKAVPNKSPLCCPIHHYPPADALLSLTWPTKLTIQAVEKNLKTRARETDCSPCVNQIGEGQDNKQSRYTLRAFILSHSHNSLGPWKIQKLSHAWIEKGQRIRGRARGRDGIRGTEKGRA